MGANENGKLDMANRIELLKKLKEELNNALTDIGGGKDVLEELHNGNHEYIFLLLLAQQAELSYLREKITEKVNKIEELENRMKSLEERNGPNDQKEKNILDYQKEIIKCKLDKLKEKKMPQEPKWPWMPKWPWEQKMSEYTEEYYKEILPDLEIIDSIFPLFSKSWRNNRHNLEVLKKLVEMALGKIENEKKAGDKTPMDSTPENQNPNDSDTRE